MIHRDPPHLVSTCTRVVLGIPSGVTEVEKRAVADAADVAATTPPSEITATSVVPPPMSTIIVLRRPLADEQARAAPHVLHDRVVHLIAADACPAHS